MGYIAVFFAPFLAIWFFQILLSSSKLLSMADASIIGIQMFGLILCLLAIEKDEDISQIDRRILTVVPSDILLILWGIIVTYLGIMAYAAEQPPSSGIHTVWDQLSAATLVIEGLLWIVSGIVFNAIIRAMRDFSQRQKTN
jgi:hypothetical protein